jgi:hypothetical protein
MAAAFALTVLAAFKGTGQTAASLTATLLTNQIPNQIKLVVTNAVAGQTYEIQRRLILGDTNYPWRTYLVGTNTQTNFVADMGIDPLGFFLAIPCTDCDMDGVPNWADAQPANAAVSNLVVTIDIPANGSTVP